jgi:hypothetical protein
MEQTTWKEKKPVLMEYTDHRQKDGRMPTGFVSLTQHWRLSD